MTSVNRGTVHCNRMRKGLTPAPIHSIKSIDDEIQTEWRAMRIPAMAIAGAGLLAGCATTELPNEGPIEAAVYTANGPVVIGNFATVEDCAAQVRAAFEDVNARASVPTTFAGGALGGCATGDAFEGDDYYLVVPDGVMLGPKFKRAGSD